MSLFERHRGSPKFFYLLTLLLWAQLIFSFGLVLWRYQLVLFQDWEVYHSNVSPGIDQYIEFVDQTCPLDSVAAHVSTSQISDYSRVRYGLYPRPVLHVVVDAESARGGQHAIHDASDLAELIQEYNVTCLIMNGAPPELAVAGDYVVFDDSRYVIIPLK